MKEPYDSIVAKHKELIEEAKKREKIIESEKKKNELVLGNSQKITSINSV